MADSGKICVKCGIDVSGSPRSKDKQGRYWCKQCFERAKAAVEQKKAAAQPAAPAQPDVMNLLVDEAVSQMGEPCPQCGNPMKPGALICTNCGHNPQTGKGAKTRVETIKQSGKAGKAAGVAAKVATGPAMILMGTVFSVIGGIVGASVWAFISYQFGYEIGWIAWGVGFVAGIGMFLGAQSQAGFITGLIAAAVALISVLGGKYAAVSLVIDDIASGAQEIVITNQDAQISMAWDFALERDIAGQELRWPGGEEPIDVERLDEFPSVVEQQVNDQWSAMSSDEQRDYKNTMEEDLRSTIGAFREAATEAGFANSFSMFDFLFFTLAVVTAFCGGAGMVGND